MSSTQARLVVAYQGLQSLGYTKDLLQENYTFVDILSDGSLRRIALAAFGQEPPSYRTACLGVTVVENDGPRDLKLYRALGAPQILEMGPNEVRRWKVRPIGDPELLQRFPTDQLPSVLQEHQAQWGPSAILRAKSIAFDAAPVQLDFYDAGLVPAIEAVVQQKLDRLLQQTIAATRAVYLEKHLGEPDYSGLFRLIFRLLAAKVLADRQHPGNWVSNSASQVIAAVEQFYFRTSPPKPVLSDPSAQDVAWKHIRHGFHFQNISVETLAHIYENTLVDPAIRRAQSIYSTPPEIAEYIVRRLPFEALQEPERQVFEPFAGHAVFLIAALRRLRELLPPDFTSERRHNYFVRMLKGLERDPFAIEVARLSLMLADYPNPDGWQLLEGDIFSDSRLPEELSKARIVLCNPPFEDFSNDERVLYRGLSATNKAVAILERTLERPPDLLGFVLPRVFRDGQSYRAVRRRIVEAYRQVEVVELPDVAFAHSDAETVLLLAHGRGEGALRLRAASVQKPDYRRFICTGQPSSEAEAALMASEAAEAPALWLDPLDRVWQALGDYPRLGSVAAIHRGIEYTRSVETNRDELVSNTPRPGFVPGLARVADGFEPYLLRSHVYLNSSPSVMRTRSYLLPWSRPKVIANAARISRGAWTIVAVPDEVGLLCYQRFHGIWPRNDLPLEVLAAFLNGPIANAFISLRRTGRDNQVRVIGDVPIPRTSGRFVRVVTELVQEYRSWRQKQLVASLATGAADQGRRLLLEIDAEVLEAYDFPPRLERDILRHFSDQRRPGPVEFTGYYSQGFRPALPLRQLVSGELEKATAHKTLERLPILCDTDISDFVTALDADS